MFRSILEKQRVALQQRLHVLRQTLALQHSDQSPVTQYRANLLIMIMVGYIIFTVILLIYGIVANLRAWQSGMVMALGVISLSAWAWGRVKRGEIELVSMLVIGMGWLMVAFVALYSGGIYSSGMLGMIALLVTGTILLNPRARMLLYCVTITYFFVLLFIELAGYLPPAPFKDLPFRIIMLTLIATGLHAIVGYHVYAIVQAERRRARLQIEAQRYEMQRIITQDLAHDLRTPTAVLRTSTYLIRKRIERGQSAEDKLQALEQQVDKLNTMIDDLFEQTKLDADDLHLSRERVDLNRVLLECLDNQALLATTRNITLINALETLPPRCTVYGDRKQLRRVFDNLIENAIHYGRQGGHITLSVCWDAAHIHISISDDGIGIAPEDQRRIFERFYRVDKARTNRKGQGTGIGLDFVQRIVHLHQGQVTLKSELGRGSTFTITLPIMDHTKPQRRRAPQAERTP